MYSLLIFKKVVNLYINSSSPFCRGGVGVFFRKGGGARDSWIPGAWMFLTQP
jgi:hypothetical protein